MSQVTVCLPDSISSEEARLYLAIKLYELGRLSCGQAAETAGYSKRAFVEILGRNGAPLSNYSADELADDLKNV
jgi:predicted HTH domain antitoxin